MRETLITTADMCMARFNATGDELFAHIAASVVILGYISYTDLDPRVWPREAYNKATDSATTKFFNDRHDARVNTGNQSLFDRH